MDVPAVASIPVSFSAPSFSADRVVRETFAIWRHNLLAFAATSVLLHAPELVLTLLEGQRAPRASGGAWSWAHLSVSFTFSALAAGALTHGTFQAIGGQRVTTGELLSAGARTFGRVFAALLNASLRIGLWSLLLLVPGVFAMCRYFVAVPAMVATRGASSSEALQRSTALTAGHRWSVFVLVFCTFGIPFILALFLGGLEGVGVVTSPFLPALNWVVAAVMSCLGDTASAVAFHHLRLEKEGVTAAQLETVFE